MNVRMTLPPAASTRSSCANTLPRQRLIVKAFIYRPAIKLVLYTSIAFIMVCLTILLIVDIDDTTVVSNMSQMEVTLLEHKKMTLFPTFHSLPPTKSMCRPDSINNTHAVISFCSTVEQPPCMQHQKYADKELQVVLPSEIKEIDEEHRNNSNIRSTTYQTTNEEECKMLWFAAMHESDWLCNKMAENNQHRYNIDYSVALNSMLEHAYDVFQPVLILGRYGMVNENSIVPTKLGRWAEEKGVKVIYSPRLSFQEDVNQGLPYYAQHKIFSHLQGPFLRLDIPKFTKEHKLFDIPNVCKDHVLYTDVDVIFANQFTRDDVQTLIQSIGQQGAGMLSYGREFSKSPEILNTGVMVMNVSHFEQVLPRILETAREAEKYPIHDQEMFNLYHESNEKEEAQGKFQLLPIYYNWKVYWGLEPSDFNQVKIVHLHGPKPGLGLEEMSKCNVTAISNFHIESYIPHLVQGMCCDQGRTAEWAINAIDSLKVSLDDLCDDDSPIDAN